MPGVIYPRDGNGYPIQILSYAPWGAQTVTANVTANVRSSAFSLDCDVVTVQANAAVYFEVGNSTVFANTSSHYLMANTPIDIAVSSGSRPDITNIAFKSLIGNAAVYISERY